MLFQNRKSLLVLFKCFFHSFTSFNYISVQQSTWTPEEINDCEKCHQIFPAIIFSSLILLFSCWGVFIFAVVFRGCVIHPLAFTWFSPHLFFSCCILPSFKPHYFEVVLPHPLEKYLSFQERATCPWLGNITVQGTWADEFVCDMSI